MNSRARLIERLRALPRTGKLAFVLLAAWSPLLLYRLPWIAAATAGLCTALFFAAMSGARLAPPSPQPPSASHEDV